MNPILKRQGDRRPGINRERIPEELILHTEQLRRDPTPDKSTAGNDMEQYSLQVPLIQEAKMTSIQFSYIVILQENRYRIYFGHKSQDLAK